MERRRRKRRRQRQLMMIVAGLALLILIGVAIYFVSQSGKGAVQQVLPDAQTTAAPNSDEVAQSIWSQNIPSGQSAFSDAQAETEPTDAPTAEPSVELTQTPTVEPTLAPTAQPTAEPTEAPRLAGVKIGIDPGHQRKANREKEPIAPGSKKTKGKVSSGTQGVKTKVPEYELVLDVSFQLRDALEALGAEVYMTRESHDVDISNIERAQMMNELGVDLVLRIHCDGSENRKTHGIGLFIRKTGAKADECLKAAEALLPAMVEATGAKQRAITQNDTYTGLNWSEVPSILVEMGYMSNPEEDERLNDPEYQAKLVEGMVEGIADYMER